MYLILQNNHPFLKKNISEFDGDINKLHKIAQQMIDTMVKHDGIGLAANQVGINYRMFVMGNKTFGYRTLINPVILMKSESCFIMREGCLSYPSKFFKIRRPSIIILEYKDLTGQVKNDIFTNIWSVCVQHEIDHLNGITFDTLEHYE